MRKKLNWEIIALVTILAFALFIRIYALGNAPLWVDEATSVSIAKNIIETGKPVLESGLNAGAYVLHYSMAFFMLFGQTEFFARLVSVLFGLATIVLAFFIGKEYSKSGGIISALFFAVFYLEVFFSRQSRYYQLFQLAFFASIYFLYKSKEKPWMIYPALVCFFITIDTHIEGLILAFFFIAHILIFNKQKWLSVIPVIPLVYKFINAVNLSTASVSAGVNYASSYLGYAVNMNYLLILFIPGLIWSFIKKKRLTLLILLPSLFTLVGVFSLQLFALRYIYFFVFPLVLFTALLMSFLYDKYGKLMLIPILLLVLVPSNLFYPQTYVNVIKPVDYQLADFSAPFTDYKNLPLELKDNIKGNALLISYYSPDVEFYLRKPDFVVPFSLNGIGEDQVSYNNSKGEVVDMYSGAKILTEVPSRPYYLTADNFATGKLKPAQKIFFQSLTANCSTAYSTQDLVVYFCK